MGQSLFTIVDSPLLEASPEKSGALDEIAKTFAEVLVGVPLYGLRTYDDGTHGLALFDLEQGEDFDSRDRGARRDAVVMDFLSSCAGNGGLPDEMFAAICESCIESQMSFQETYDEGYVVYSFEFTETGVAGTSSTYQLDAAADEYELTDHSQFATPIPAKKRPVKKSAPKKPTAKKATAEKAATKAAPPSKGAPAPSGKGASGGISGKTFLFTGTLTTMTRAEAEGTVKANGGTVLSGVTDRLDYLVVGEKAGSKLVKAKKIPRITILTEAEFARLK